MRTMNSIKNTFISFLTNGLTILAGLISQKVFIQILGKEYLGINGLFSNIISMLAIVELGIGSAIIYNLYKPIADQNVSKINSLMNFYKKCYHIIAMIVFILGLSLVPFLNLFVGDTTINIQLELVFILFVLDIVCSYLLSYKRSIIQANQRNYIVNFVHVGYLVLLNTFQIMILRFTKNYYFYLIIKILMRLLENIVITYIANKMHSYLNDVSSELDSETKEDIFKKVKALFFHKLGAFFVLGTDNIIISKFLGIIQVGLYSNYYLIINAVQTLFGQAIQVLTPSVGNLLVENNKDKNYEVFKKVRFLNFWIATFSGVSLLVIMDSFISIWIGKEYILPFFVLCILVFNYYQKSMRTSYMVFKEAAGIFYEDRFVPLIESALNIIASIILLKYFGLAGVFMGTIISGLILWCYSYPKYVYKELFKRNYLSYALETICYIMLFLFIATITYCLSNFISFQNIYVNFIMNILVSLIIPNVILFLAFYKTDNFQYYSQLLKRIIQKRGV